MAVLVGKKAPDFSASAVVNGNEMVDNFTLSQFHGKKYVILFFWPLDFTFVCPTEIIAFEKARAEFEKRNVQLIGVSTDSANSHFAWLNTPQNKGGIEGVQYPLVADLDKTISMAYDVLAGDYDWEEDENGNLNLVFSGVAPIAYRGLFLIDKDGIVRHQLVNDFPLGRNIDEALRLVSALQYTEEHGEVCPADWEEGKEAIKPTLESTGEYLAKH